MSGEHGHPDLADQGASLHAGLVAMAARVATLEAAQSATDAVTRSLLDRVATLEAAPPVEPPAPPPPAPLWSTDYADLGAFDSTPWNNVPTAPRVTTLDGQTVGAYSIPSGGSRCENVPTGLRFTRGDVREFRLRTRLADVPTTSDWQVAGCQWKNDGAGSPPLAMSINRGAWEIGGGWGWPGTDTPTTPKMQTRPLGPVRLDSWDEWRVRVLFHDDPAVGAVDVWRNGTQMVTGWKPVGGTLYPGLSSYLKVGYYRSTSIRSSAIVYIDRIEVLGDR